MDVNVRHYLGNKSAPLVISSVASCQKPYKKKQNKEMNVNVNYINLSEKWT